MSAIIGDGTLNHEIDPIKLVLYILNLIKGHQNCIIHSKVMAFFVDFVLWFLHLGNFRNLNLTLESPQIFNRRSKIPDGRRNRDTKLQVSHSGTQEVFDSHLSGKIKWSQTHVILVYIKISQSISSYIMISYNKLSYLIISHHICS